MNLGFESKSSDSKSKIGLKITEVVIHLEITVFVVDCSEEHYGLSGTRGRNGYLIPI